ncbi:hypothetical protein EJB05_43507 [Eragrostis curvula]|uniref:Transposase MuDR plant domain-containing protein n=1 Tax=Eragrostis curvula TaxID=38414 RepID=A0A5J9TFB4_9POAL|nr:hypothetical protein EJB05_43507 [Eragrostis curvula]
MNLDKGVVHIIAEINDFEGPLQCSPTKRSLHPKVRERLLETPSTPSLNLDPCVEPTPLTQSTPTKERTTSTKKKVTSSKGSKKSMSDGSVGVDEEGMYFDTDSLVAMSDSSYDTDLAASSNSDIDPSDVEYDPDDDIVHEDDDDDDIPLFSYDVDDPCIDVGVVFPDVKQCREAVTHHAIINNHAFKPTRTDSDKFRAVCKRADQGCKWKFYATTSKKKYIGCKVKISGPKHTCGSVFVCF